jgi:hypothetical protein
MIEDSRVAHLATAAAAATSTFLAAFFSLRYLERSFS